jgi:2-isopropylmalate synthase
VTARITIFDTTLRDGEQSPGCSMTIEEKVRLARQLEALGVDVIEAGFPIASEGDFEAVRAVADGTRGPVVAALSRANEADVLRAAEALESAAHPRIHTFIATSDIHLLYKLHRTREEVLAATAAAVRLARQYVDDVEFSAEDATRSDPEFLCEVVKVAAGEGATTVNIPDTVGYTTPAEYAALIRRIRAHVPSDTTISVHCHNDLGLAVANSLAALDAGARQVECTINGIGERAGNAALEEIVMACNVRGDRLPFTTGIRTREIYATSQLLSQLIRCPVQPNKAVVGRNAFAHEAGIHQHGVLSNPLCYEIMAPETVGAPASEIVLGKHSGRHTISGDELNAVYTRFMALADRKKRIYDQDVLGIVDTVVHCSIAEAG